MIPMKEAVAGIDRFFRSLDCWHLVEEDLSVSQLPVAETDHEQRRLLKDPQRAIVQAVVQERWLLIEISKLNLFSDIHVAHGKTSNRKENRESNAMSEGDKDHIHHRGILQVEGNIRSGV